MSDDSIRNNSRHHFIRTFLILPIGLAAALSATAADTAPEQAVKTLNCKNGKTVAQYLEHKLPANHRDLGWRVFPVENSFDVERAFLVSKNFELRYRWRVDGVGQVREVNEPARNLCS
jgi:hypothetical protein